MSLRLLDLFSGFGMFSLGLERSGVFRTVAFCEIEPYPGRVLSKHWPSIPIHRDIRELRGEQIGAIDAICGGFPCQDISFAGTGAGIDGSRSGLWSEYARIIGELRPRFVIVENVAALLVRGLGRVLGDLAALGYDAWWDCIPASAVGAPHRRDRLWLVAYLADADCGGRGRLVAGRKALWGNTDLGRNGAGGYVADAHLFRQSGPGHTECDGEAYPARQTGGARGGGEVLDAKGCGCGAGRARGFADAGAGQSVTIGALFNPDTFRERLEGLLEGWAKARTTDRPGDGCDPGWWQSEPDVGRVANGVVARVERLRGLGNGLVPTIPYLIGTAIGLTLAANARTKEQAAALVASGLLTATE